MASHNVVKRRSESKVAKSTPTTGDAATPNKPVSIQPGQPLSPDYILYLQRTIGNHAVQRVIGQRDAVANAAVPPLPGLPPGAAGARPAAAAPGAILSWTQFRAQILAQAREPASVGRRQQPKVKRGAVDYTPQRDAVIEPIKAVYLAFDGTGTLPDLIKLYHKLDQWYAMFWDHDSMRAAGLRTPGVQAVLDTARLSIERRVRNETAKNGVDSNAVLAPGSQNAGKAKRIAFFDDVGVPIEFYSKLTKKQVALFKSLYDALRKNKTAFLPGMIATLAAENIVGFPLIKGLFLTRFPDATWIKNLQTEGYQADRGTKEAAYTTKIRQIKFTGSGELTEDELKNEAYGVGPSSRLALESNKGGKTVSKALTNAELAALQGYTSDDYNKFNKLLRENDGSAAGFDAVAENRSRIDVVVSALNKLPAYNGLAYRMLNLWPDFDAAVHPGGVFTDPAFMSASMTAEGAELGGTSGGLNSAGALEVYEIIHTKGARHVTILSLVNRETEVLFKPGTRFKVDAIWTHINGQIPKDAPSAAQMILLRTGEIKTKSVILNGTTTVYTGKVRVVEMTEI